MPDKLISIILPVFNGVEYLEVAIQSILNQTYENFELIIVDDASTDGSPEIISRYAAFDGRLKSFRNRANRRLPYSLNCGFAEARGDYLTWTSHDNYYAAEALQEMANLLDHNPEIALVYSDYTVIDEQGNPVRPMKVHDPNALAYSDCIGGSFLYRRALRDGLEPYDEQLFLAEDYDFWLRASQRFRFHPLHKNLYFYRSHQNSLTSRYSARVHLQIEKALSSNLPKMTWLGKDDLSHGYLRCLYLVSLRKDVRSALRYLWLALRSSPKYAIYKISKFLLSRYKK